jgi:hypothetical protein
MMALTLTSEQEKTLEEALIVLTRALDELKRVNRKVDSAAEALYNALVYERNED